MTHISDISPAGRAGRAALGASDSPRPRWRVWVRRVVLVSLLVAVGVIGFLGLQLYRSGVRPDWYRKALSEQARAAAQKAAEAKLLSVQNWMQDGRLYSSSGQDRPRLPNDPVAPPPDTHTLTLTEDELNSFLEPHEKALLAKFGQWIEAPYIRLHEGQIIIAVTLKDTGRVLSVYVTPSVADDGLKLSIDHLVFGESVTVPEFLWSGYLRKLGEQCRPKLDSSRSQAGWVKNELYQETDIANEAAVIASLNRLVLRAIEKKGADPVLFLPVEGKFDRGHPIRVTSIKVENAALAMTFQPLTRSERTHLMKRIRAEYGQEPPPPLTTTRPTGVAAK